MIMVGLERASFSDLENNGSRPPLLASIQPKQQRKISPEAAFVRLWRKVAATKTSPANRINIMARTGARGGVVTAELSFRSSRLSANESIGGRAPFGLITPKFKQNF